MARSGDTTQPLSDLIRRLEEATGDDDIGLWRDVNLFAREQGWVDQFKCEQNLSVIVSAFHTGMKDLLLTVALTLVPDGKTWGIGKVWDKGRFTGFAAVCRNPGVIKATDIEPEATTPALALCVAALRARAQ